MRDSKRGRHRAPKRSVRQQLDEQPLTFDERAAVALIISVVVLGVLLVAIQIGKAVQP